MKHLITIFILLIMPLALHAQEEPFVDLGLTSSDIFFTVPDPLIAGAELRLYARIHNHGDVDVQGFVEFFQGTVPVGQSQIISVRSGGVPEEVFVDFVVPSGSFNIRADIKGTDPQDQNPSNDSAFTTLFTPVFDDDGDGVPNESDNCVNTANSDQTDTDGDGLGDACDDDDDNDGVTDDVENEIGSDPTNGDSDNDGVGDADDAFPTDPNKTVIPPPQTDPPTTIQEEPSELEGLLEDILEGAAEELAFEAEAAEENDVEPVLALAEPSDLGFSPRAIFSYSRKSWNSFEFKALTPKTPGYRFEWDFGDGVTSNRHQVEHVYTGSGNFDVTLKITDPAGNKSKDSTVVSVPFFTLQNNMVIGLIGILSLMLLFGSAFAARIGYLPAKARKKQKQEKIAPEATKIVVKDGDLET